MTKGKWYHTSWRRVGIEINIDNLKLHIQTIESLLKRKSGRLSRQIDREAEKLSPDERHHLYDRYSDDFWRVNEVFPSIYRNSMLITIFSFLENQLNIICRELAPKAQCDIGLTDLSHRGIERCKVYLNKVVGVPFPSDTQYWRDIKIHSEIRNIIVHNDSRLDDSRVDHKRIKDYVNNSQHLKLDDLNTIQIGEGFLLLVIDSVSKLFREIFERLPDF